MKAKKSKDPRQRILDAAVTLFAQKGYAGVGVREIAKAADVNIAMISYYFEGKVGILKVILEEFHNQYYQVIKDIDMESSPPEECVRMIVRNMVDLIKENTERAMVSFNALPLDIPEIADIKAKRVSELIKAISGLADRYGLDPNDAVLISIIGPFLISTILAHFRFKRVQKHIFKIKFNDTFYERYKETIATLFLYGITGIAAQKQKEKKRGSR
jgi:AcrR family transcriptional regulator